MSWPEEWCGFQHSKCSSNHIWQGIAFKLYSTGQRLKFIYWFTQEVFKYQTKKAWLHVSMCRHCVLLNIQQGILSAVCVLMNPPVRVCIHVTFWRSKNTFEVVYLALCSLHFHIEFSLLSWSPFKNAVCSAATGKRRYWTKLMCISIGKPMHCRSLWVDNIILLSVLYNRSLHAPRYPIHEDHSLETVSARQNPTEEEKNRMSCLIQNDVISKIVADSAVSKRVSV